MDRPYKVWGHYGRSRSFKTLETAKKFAQEAFNKFSEGEKEISRICIFYSANFGPSRYVGFWTKDGYVSEEI